MRHPFFIGPCARLRLTYRFGCLLAWLTLAATTGLQVQAEDKTLVALWLFDEPDYMNMTLTDAGAGMYDLRLEPGGALEPGRFGNALRMSSLAGPAVSYPKGPTRYDIGLIDSVASRVPDARPVYTPSGLVEALTGDAWTLEFWLRVTAPVNVEATVFEIGHGREVTWSCRIAPGGEALALLLDNDDTLTCPIDGTLLNDGRWHHVAITREGGADSIRVWLDGSPQPTPRPGATPVPNPDALHPGLIGLIYGDTGRQWPVNVRVAGKLDLYEGIKTLFSEVSYQHRWMGLLRAPVDGEIEFNLATDNPATLTLDGQTVLTTSDGAFSASGRYTCDARRLHEVVLDVIENGGDSAVRLSWRLPGRAWETVPEGVFVHRQADLSAAWAEVEAFADRLERMDTLPGWEWERVSWPRPEGAPPVEPELARMAEGLAQRFYLSLGGETLHAAALDGMMDELRVSQSARYDGSFMPPGSFSRNYGPESREPTEATAPPLLFADDEASGVIALGGRKHLFIDDVMIESRGFVRFRANPPEIMELTDLANNEPWEHPTKGAFGDMCFVDHNGEIRMYYMNNAMWEEPDLQHTVCVATSKDGLHFEKPSLGMHDWDGSRENNIVFKLPLQGRIFVDSRPGIPPEERFKCSGQVMDRGVFLFTSPDGIHWKRNETIMLPFDAGGGVEMFWDDQRGLYHCYLRHEGWVFYREPYGRAAALAQTRQPFKPWPFNPVARPIPRYDSWTLPSITEELPAPFTPYPVWSGRDARFRVGQVYRTRAVKYEWAPDTYVAFTYRLFGVPVQAEESRKTQLAVSRDGEHWTSYEDVFYYDNDWEYDGRQVVECLAVDGLTRRGNELWQYLMVKFSSHVMWSDQDRIFRTRQRLDGFVSMSAQQQPGWAMTRPFTFEGDRLELNIASRGQTKVGLLDEQGSEIPEFSLAECDPINADAVDHAVTWNGVSDVSRLAGRPVRLRLEMHDADLFAFQFVGSTSEAMN